MNNDPVTTEDDDQISVPIPIRYQLLPDSASKARMSGDQVIVPLLKGDGPAVVDWTIHRGDAYGLIEILREQLKQTEQGDRQEVWPCGSKDHDTPTSAGRR